jgi:hypothetical protein
MAIDDYAFTAEDVKSRLHGLFEAAKAVDEFEFGCTLAARGSTQPAHRR